jgi:Flagellar assembly protein T, C-terminal domain
VSRFSRVWFPLSIVFEQEVVMRHPLAALTAGVLLAATGALTAADGSHPALTRESAPAPVPLVEKIVKTPRTVTGPLPIGVETDVYCSGYIGELGEIFPGAVVSAEKEKNQTFFMLGDIVYIDIGERDGVQAGMEFTVVRPRQAVNKWGSVTEVVGRIYTTPGRVRVICAQERSSIAEVSYSCMDVQVGDFIVPFEPVPVPLVRRSQPATMCDAPNGKMIGHILETRLGETPVATDSVVYLDLGEADGLNPGDFLTVFRPSGRAEGVRTILGEASILMTRSRTSVAIITMTTDTMGVGDAVEVK